MMNKKISLLLASGMMSLVMATAAYAEENVDFEALYEAGCTEFADMLGWNMLANYDNKTAMQTVYAVMYDGLMKGERQIEIRDSNTAISTKEAGIVVDVVHFDHPELAIVGATDGFGLTYDMTNGDAVYYKPYYIGEKVSSEEAEERLREVNNVVDPVLEDILAHYETDYDITKAVHDWLCENVTYDFDFDGNCHNMFGALLEGDAVCDGYAKAFQYMLRKCGIESFIATGSVDGEGHAWNIVNVDGQWTYIDVTWDDVIPEEIIYDFFCVSKKTLETDHVFSESTGRKDYYRYFPGGVTIVPGEEPKPHEHTVVVDKAVEPTYTENGLTEGSHCSECGQILVEQKVIDKLIHTGWYNEAGKWYLYSETGDMLTGWQQVSGTWYYMETDGAMVTGWKQIAGTWFFFDKNGYMTTGWKQISGKWYYFNKNGYMVTGWSLISNKWYYFSADGDMSTGWKLISGKYYYFTTDGDMVTGWKYISNVWYYFTTNGDMATGWKLISGTYYYFDRSGAMKTGWVLDAGTWYYMDNSGAMVANKSLVISGKTYRFSGSGACLNP